MALSVYLCDGHAGLFFLLNSLALYRLPKTYQSDEMLSKLLRYLMLWLLVFAGVAFALWRNYEYVYSGKSLLSFETCLKFVEEDVLGKRLYSETCERSSYSEQVELLNSSSDIDKPGACQFIFHPIPGKEKACPAVTISVSRYTGEAWVTNVEK